MRRLLLITTSTLIFTCSTHADKSPDKNPGRKKQLTENSLPKPPPPQPVVEKDAEKKSENIEPLTKSMASSESVGYGIPASLKYANHTQYTYTGFTKYVQCYDNQNPCREGSVKSYYLYEPIHQLSSPLATAFVVYIHGYDSNWSGLCHEEMFKDWARRGFTVIAPVFMDSSNMMNFESWSNHTLNAIKHGLTNLKSTVPKKDEQGAILTAYVAHSIGSYIAANVASKANADQEKGGVPIPKGIILHDAAGYNFKQFCGISEQIIKSWKVPATTDILLLSAEGTLNETNSVSTASEFKSTFDACCSLSLSGKFSSFILPSQQLATGTLLSSHNASSTSGTGNCKESFDAVDWWMYLDQTNAHLYYHFEGKYQGQLHGGTDENGVSGLFNGCVNNISPCQEMTKSCIHPMKVITDNQNYCKKMPRP